MPKAMMTLDRKLSGEDRTKNRLRANCVAPDKCLLVSDPQPSTHRAEPQDSPGKRAQQTLGTIVNIRNSLRKGPMGTRRAAVFVADWLEG